MTLENAGITLMSVQSLKVLGLCSVLLVPVAPAYADSRHDEALNQLLVQGHFWYARGRSDLTERAWKKVLLVEPDNFEALSGLEELSRFNPNNIDRNKLRLARELARQRRYEEALATYKAAFRGKPPTSFYTAEYFETLSGTEDGWSTARAGLEALVQTYPSNPRYELALGRVQTYREETRNKGIELLATLATRPGINEEMRQQAINAWRDALLWLADDPANKALMTPFLEVVPGDIKVRDKIKHLKSGKGSVVSNAYAALDDGKLSQAMRLFRTILKTQPSNADALAGLGIAQVRRKQFSAATRNLQRALKQDPAKKEALEPLLLDARYWAKYNQADAARNKGQYEKAERLGQALLRLRPQQREAQLLLARILVEGGKFEQAVIEYENVLKSHPGNKQAQQGMIGALIQHNPVHALELINQYGLSEVEYKMARDTLDAATLSAQAEQETDPNRKIVLLEKARLLTPDDPWIALDLARQYRSLGRNSEADELLAKRSSKTNDALYATAIFHTEAQQWQAAQQAITQIPAMQRSREQQVLADKITGHNLRQRAAILIQEGKTDLARKLAVSLREQIEGHAELRLLYADLLLDLGETDAGIWVADDTMKHLTVSDPDLYIQYASILLKTEQLAKLKTHLVDLRSRVNLTDRQKNSVARLTLGAALTTAERQRQAGQPQLAYRTLAPYFDRFGQDPAVQMALATIYQDTKDHQPALNLYQKVMAQNPDNIDAQNGAFGAALALGNYALAETLSNDALERFPDTPKLLVQRARLRLIRGEREQAYQDLSKAVTSVNPEPETIAVTDFPLPSGAQPQPQEQDPEWLRQARNTLDRLDDSKHSFINGALSFRNREGENGLDELREISIPITYKHILDLDRSVSVQARYVSLDAGSLAVNPDSAARLGSLILQPATVPATPLPQDDEGFAVGIRYQGQQWSGDIGSTPLGFEIENLVGGVTWRQRNMDNTIEAELSRRTVTESLLSYAGTTDPATGQSWGGVTTTGLRGKFSSHKDNRGYIGELDYRILRGDSVADNDQIKLQGGIYWKPDSIKHHALQLGANLVYQRFDQNLRYFTVGHGGYFSPQQYFSIGLPVDYKQQNGRLNYQLGAQLGIQWFKEDSADRFPEQTALQDRLERNNAVNNIQTNGYNGQDETGLTYAVKGNLEYAFTQQFSLGGWFAANKSNDYKESGGGIYLRYYTAPRTLRNASPEINTYSEVW